MNDMCIHSFNNYHSMPHWEVALTYIPTPGIWDCSPGTPSPSPGFHLMSFLYALVFIWSKMHGFLFFFSLSILKLPFIWRAPTVYSLTFTFTELTSHQFLLFPSVYWLLFEPKYQRVRRRQWHPTPVLLSGKSHGRRSLIGCSPWGR